MIRNQPTPSSGGGGDSGAPTNTSSFSPPPSPSPPPYPMPSPPPPPLPPPPVAKSVVSVTYGIDGYTATTFNEDAKRAFINGMASVLRVDPNWINVTSVIDDLSAAAARATAALAGLGADASAGGVSITFTVKAIDDTQAINIGATLNTLSTVEGGGGNTQSVYQEKLLIQAMQKAGLSKVHHVKRETTVTKANIAAQGTDDAAKTDAGTVTTNELGIDPAEIGGIVIGVLVFLAICGYCCYKVNKSSSNSNHDDDEYAGSYGEGGYYYTHRSRDEQNSFS